MRKGVCCFEITNGSIYKRAGDVSGRGSCFPTRGVE